MSQDTRRSILKPDVALADLRNTDACALAAWVGQPDQCADGPLVMVAGQMLCPSHASRVDALCGGPRLSSARERLDPIGTARRREREEAAMAALVAERERCTARDRAYSQARRARIAADPMAYAANLARVRAHHAKMKAERDADPVLREAFLAKRRAQHQARRQASPAYAAKLRDLSRKAHADKRARSREKHGALWDQMQALEMRLHRAIDAEATRRRMRAAYEKRRAAAGVAPRKRVERTLPCPNLGCHAEMIHRGGRPPKMCDACYQRRADDLRDELMRVRVALGLPAEPPARRAATPKRQRAA